jgi:hypothetical protein
LLLATACARVRVLAINKETAQNEINGRSEDY